MSSEKSLRTSSRKLDALTGCFLGMGAPLGWLVWRFVYTQRMVIISWLKNELFQFGSIYGYMAIGTITVFTLFGYFLGRRNDDVLDDSNLVKKTLNKVNELAMTDALTGIHNARYLHDHLSLEIEQAKRHQTPLSCLMLDIDGFKGINDTHGHPYGDTVLATISKTILESIRRVDTVGRLGGEEFLVLMPQTGGDAAFIIAERIRQSVQRWPFMANKVDVPVTVSIGVASCSAPGVIDKAGLLKAVDDALYEAKRGGKNKTVVSKGIKPP